MSTQTVRHLLKEHREINRVLDAFELFLERSRSEAGPDRHELWRLIDALSESLFLRHEEKEETVLLPHLNRMGLSWTDGTLAHVRQDHRHGRYLLRSVRYAAHQSLDWNSDDRRHFLAVGKEWAEFIRRHMAREESMLFPYLDAELSEQADRELMGHFAAIDSDFENMPDHGSLCAGKDEFLRRYAMAHEEVAHEEVGP